MSQAKSKEAQPPNLNLIKRGSWKDIITISENTESLLRSVKPENVEGKITQKEFDNLAEKWEEWRPCTEDDFSEEMREKTAEHSSVDESKIEEEGKETKDEVKNAGESIKKAATDAENGGLGEAKKHLKEAIKFTGRAVESEVRQGFRKVEEKIYENLILKANSLYFDNSALNAILSKRLGADSSERYQLTLHSNNPRLREFFAERINWDDC